MLMSVSLELILLAFMNAKLDSGLHACLQAFSPLPKYWHFTATTCLPWAALLHILDMQQLQMR